jgi:hypothetical protein
MALKIKVLGMGKLGTVQAAIYGPVPTGTAAILKSMRFVNPGTGTYTFNVFIKRAGDTARYLLARDKSIAPNEKVSDASEVTLEYNDSIEAYSGTSNTIEYVLSGIERDA